MLQNPWPKSGVWLRETRGSSQATNWRAAVRFAKQPELSRQAHFRPFDPIQDEVYKEHQECWSAHPKHNARKTATGFSVEDFR